MRYLKYKMLFIVINLTFYSILLGSSKDNLSQLSSNLNSLAQYSRHIKPIAPIVKPYTPTGQTSRTKPAYTPTGQTIQRDHFFSEIVGETEQQFQHHFGWITAASPADNHLPHGNGELTNPPNKQWKKEKLRPAIFQGKFKTYTLEELATIAQEESLPTDNPYFRIIIHNPNVPEQTDIRYLQSDPQLANANFQIASTLFGPLEGGMYMKSGSITNMLQRPVQGEEACISAAPATIYRKYFMEPEYLLYNLRNKFNITYGSHGPHIQAIPNMEYGRTDEWNIAIGIHKDVVVSSGYGAGRGRTDTQEKLPIIIKNGKVDTTKTQIINQIFNGAYDLKEARGRNGTNMLPDYIEDAAKMIIRGMYSATLRAPWISGSQEIVLTLLGASAFLNDLSWIAEALEEEYQLIKHNGLEVTLIYRPDSKPTRNINTDRAFLRQMFILADKINGSNLASDHTFNKYIEDYLNASYPNADSKKQAQAAHALNTMINNALPTYAPKIKLTSSYGPITHQPSTPTGPTALEEIMGLKDGHKLAWLLRKNDAVLVNLDPATSNYFYVAPNYPSQRLPNGLYYWKTQGLDKSIIGNHKAVVYVKNHPKGRDFVYSRTKNAFVDSHHKENVWDPTRYKNDR